MNEREKIQVNGTQIDLFHVQGLAHAEVSPQLRQKLLDRDDLCAASDFLRGRGLKVIYTSGVYDVIHNGHARYLQLAKSLGDVLVVGLNSDESVRALKGPHRPILNQNERAEMLSFLDSVDYITMYDEPTGIGVIRELKPDGYLCVEGSWEGDLETKEEVIAMAEVGGVVYCAPRQNPSISTTGIIERIEAKYGERVMAEFGDLMKGNDE